MIKPGNLNLQQRLVLALLGVAFVTAGIVGGILFSINERVEVTIWRETLEAELLSYLQRQYSDSSLAPIRRRSINTYVREPRLSGEAKVTSSLAHFEPGLYVELPIGGRLYCILVRDLSGQRYYVTYDVTDLEKSQEGLILMGLLLLLLVSGVLVLFSFRLSRWLLSPIQDLADSVSSLDADSLEVTLAEKYQSNEVKVIASAIDGFLLRIRNFILREKEFSAMASHEFRTPIAAIFGAVEVLLSKPEIQASGSKALKRIYRNAKELEETITGLLFLSRERDSSVSPEEKCEVNLLLPGIVENHLYLIGDKELVVEISRNEPIIVNAPSRMVSIVVGNLIRNAIQHTSKGVVQVGLSGGQFVVTDTGPGMSASQIAQVQRSLGGSEKSSTRQGGLGLYIIQNISDKFGWEISFASQQGHGTTVRLNFLK